MVSCHRCGETVRVPRNLPAREAGGAPEPPFPPAVAALAASGVRLVRIGVWLAALQLLLLAGTYAAWAGLLGPTSVVRRDPGDYGSVLNLVWGLDLALFAARVAVKAVGYRRATPAGRSVQAEGWLHAALVLLALQLGGYLVSAYPWLAGRGFDSFAPASRAGLQIGHMMLFCGVAGEVVVLIAWYRLHAELAGPAAARGVLFYFYALLGTFLTLSAAFSATMIAVFAAVRRSQPEHQFVGPPGKPVMVAIDLERIPPGGFDAIGAYLVLVLVGLLALAWFYDRALLALGRALRPAGRADAG